MAPGLSIEKPGLTAMYIRPAGELERVVPIRKGTSKLIRTV